jgi:hypothetical protein
VISVLYSLFRIGGLSERCLSDCIFLLKSKLKFGPPKLKAVGDVGVIRRVGFEGDVDK